jgi:hypothetical protein
VLGDMNTGFTPGMLSSDSVRPNNSGYDFMADAWYKVAWYKVISPLLH